MNLLLGVFSTFAKNFVERIKSPAIIVALCCAIVGLALAVLGRRVARVVRKSDKIEDNDAVLISFKAVGLVFLFVSILIIILRAGA